MNTSGPILIVDDEPNVRLGFRTALLTAGYLVEEADCGPNALEHLERSRCEVVLLDLLMPGMDGMEVLRRLRDRGDEIPVVIITAHGSIPDAVAAMKLGAVDFLSKPLAPTELRRVVHEVLSRHAMSEPETAPMPAPPWRARPITVTISPAAVDLTRAKLALNHRDFDRAAELLEHALDLAPDSAEVLTLAGVLRETCGQYNAAYHLYKAALKADPRYGPARESMRRYCERTGLDYSNKMINPGAD